MAESGNFIAICKKEALILVSDNEEMPISNLGALRMGLEALMKEDASDNVRANQLWAEAKALLAQESEDDQGAGASGRIQVEDDFDVLGIGGPSCGGFWP